MAAALLESVLVARRARGTTKRPVFRERYSNNRSTSLFRNNLQLYVRNNLLQQLYVNVNETGHKLRQTHAHNGN